MKSNIKRKHLRKIGFILMGIAMLVPLFTFITPQVSAFDLQNPLATTNDDTGIIEIIKSIVSWIQGISIIVATLVILIGGVAYIIGGTNQNFIQTANKIFTYAAIGFFMIFVGASVLALVLEDVGIDDEAKKALEGQYKPMGEIIRALIEEIIKYLMLVGIIVIMISGLVWMTTASSDRKNTAKNIFQYAVIGIIIAILAWSIVDFLETLTVPS